MLHPAVTYLHVGVHGPAGDDVAIEGVHAQPGAVRTVATQRTRCAAFAQVKHLDGPALRPCQNVFLVGVEGDTLHGLGVPGQAL